MRTCLIVPTLNGEHYLGTFFRALTQQVQQPDEIIIVDSESSDGTADICRREGVKFFSVKRAEFNHGGTREYAASKTSAEILVYMTQDAILEGTDSFGRLVDGLLREPDIGVAYGRQLPHINASPIAAHHRRFNYPNISVTKRFADRAPLGIKTCFCSDSFAAYKTGVLHSVGGFPSNVIHAEDQYVTAKMLLAGYAVRYEASAQVRHSHDYTIVQDFRRYFDAGVFFNRESWILDAFGGPSSEGFKFFISELRYLVTNGHSWLLPSAIMHTISKWTGFNLGLREQAIPRRVKSHLGMFRGYWKSA